MRTTLEELGHQRPATPMQTDNSIADGIMNKSMKQKQSKAMDKRFYWLQDRIKQGIFRVFWVLGKYNLANYFKKYYSLATHRKLSLIYTYIEDKRPASLEGCIEILTSIGRPKPLPLHSNNKTSTQDKLLYSNISNITLYKLTNALKQRMMNRLA